MKPVFLLFCCALWSGGCGAIGLNEDYLDQLRQAALQKRLYQAKAWLALGHYRQASWRHGKASEADDAAFFFARDGKYDPKAELSATLEGFFSAEGGDNHPQCRFPARYHWLKEQLSFDPARLPERHCQAFDEWRARLQAHSVSLIFPASYLNSPSSMFGHIFIRLDQPDQNENNRLLAYTINYAADARAYENELLYAYKGIFGGYPGITSVEPFYEKVKEYSEWENRDIWEYPLDLTPREVDQLLRHVWEIRSIRFDYFFFDENCAYRILALLEAARPSLSLLDAFKAYAIPADTIRAVVAAGVVTQAVYRPSAATTIQHHIRQLPKDLQKLAKDVADGDAASHGSALKSLTHSRQAAVLELAFEYLRYRALDQRQPREQSARRSYQLLLARSRIEQPSPFAPIPTPSVRPDQGHDTSRLAAGLGYREERGFLSLQYRLANHDLTDPWPGYQAGAQIETLGGTLRYYGDGRLQVEQLTVLNITSLTPRNRFLQPVSWSIDLGARRKLLKRDRPLVGFLEGGAGLSYHAGDGQLFGLLETTLEVSSGLEKDFDFGAGLRLGWLYRGAGGQGLLGFKSGCFIAGDDYCAGKIWLEHTLNLSKNQALRFNLSRERSQGNYASEIGLAFLQYF